MEAASKAPVSASLWAARIISVLTHPIWLPLAYACSRAWGDPQLPKLLIVLGLCLVAFPGAVAMLWMWIRRETDWYIMAQANRLVPMVAGLIGMAFFAVASGAVLPERLFMGELMAIMILLIFISIIVNLFWKISVHMLGWGAVVAVVGFQAWENGGYLLLAAVAATAVAVAWARIKVGSHDIAQVIAGFLGGAAAAALMQVMVHS